MKTFFYSDSDKYETNLNLVGKVDREQRQSELMIPYDVVTSDTQVVVEFDIRPTLSSLDQSDQRNESPQGSLTKAAPICTFDLQSYETNNHTCVNVKIHALYCVSAECKF